MKIFNIIYASVISINMQYTSEYPYLIVMSVVFVFALVLSKVSFFSVELEKESSSRLSSIDGLRGLLALGVFFHHSIIMYYYYMNGTWKVPPSTFYTLLGEASVPLFFMITGFLFWSKILGSKFDVKNFYIRRIQRIVPLYIFTTVVVILIVFINTNFTIMVDSLELVIQLVRWFSFTFLGTPDINGFKDTFTIESVYWTLRWEWIFYLSLPLLALFKSKSYILIMTLIAISIYFQQIHLLNFVLGLLAANIITSPHVGFLRHKLFYFVGIIAMFLLFVLFTRGYGTIQSILLFVFFLSIVFDNTLFGILKTKAMRFLGLISYSIYLLHNILVWSMFKVWNYYEPIKEATPLTIWMLILTTAVLVVWISSVTYKYIEHYFYVSKFTLFRKREVNAN